MEKELTPKFTLNQMTESDIEESTAMRLQSWRETYVNEDYGVTAEWIEYRNREQMSDEKSRLRLERFRKGKADDTFNAWVTRDAEGKIIGSTTPFVDAHGTQRLGSLYVDKEWHGTGVAGTLMQQVIDWFDGDKPIELMVATYNERAKVFYRKWGFEEVPDSEALFDDKIPAIKMIRRSDGIS